jgi:hypothetical protein
VGHRHLLGDPALQPDHLDVFDRALRLKRLRSHHVEIASGEGVEVFVRDAAGRPPALPSGGHTEQLEGQARNLCGGGLKRRT